MTAHKHAELMMEYAKDAAETDKPWERWQHTWAGKVEWVGLVRHPEWIVNDEYRRKPDAYQRWINVFDDGSTEDFSSREAAVNEADSYGRENYSRVAIHMKEVE